MKLRSGRKYKKDLSDIIGILYEHQQSGNVITMQDIDKAVCNLYGSWDVISEDSKSFINSTFENENLEDVYNQVYKEEYENKSIIQSFETNYPDVANSKNVDDILKQLKDKKNIEKI